MRDAPLHGAGCGPRITPCTASGVSTLSPGREKGSRLGMAGLTQGASGSAPGATPHGGLLGRLMTQGRAENSVLGGQSGLLSGDRPPAQGGGRETLVEQRRHGRTRSPQAQRVRVV